MRPVRLEMQGFSTFRERTVIDFTDVELLALVGPTGSGKSSVIDAITFALYGSAARYDEKAVAPVINQLSTEARVQFEFQVSGESYTATRVVRRTAKGGGTTKEARFDHGDTLVAGDAKAVTAAVVQLLGLDFARFNKTVVLPQGKFSEFLHDTPAARQELLRDLLGFGVYERLGRQARERASQLQAQALAFESTIGDVSELSPERLALLQASVHTIGRVRATVAAAAAVLADAEAELAISDRRLAEFDGHLQLLGSVSVPSGVHELSVTLVGVARAADTAGVTRDQGRAVLRSANDAVVAGPSLAASTRLLDAYVRQRQLAAKAVDAQERARTAAAVAAAAFADGDAVRRSIDMMRAATVQARVTFDTDDAALRAGGDRSALQGILTLFERADAATVDLERLQASTTAAAADAAIAVAERDATRAAVVTLERRVPAAALATHLHVGDACPVCDQTVHTIPVVRDVSDDELSLARRERDVAERATTMAEQTHLAAAARTSALHDEQRARFEQLAPHDRAEVVTQLESLTAWQAQADEGRARLVDAERAVAAAESDPSHRAAVAAEQRAVTVLAAAEALAAQASADEAAGESALRDQPAEHVVAADLERAQELATAKHRAEHDEEAAEQCFAEAKHVLDAAVAADAEARRRYQSARDGLAMLQPPAATASLADDWDTLVGWCALSSGRLGDERRDIAAARATTLAGRDALMSSIRAQAGEFVGRPDAPVDGLRDQLAAAEARAVGVVEQFERDRARVADAQQKVASLQADAAVASMLGNLLRATGFQRWLLEEAMNDLVTRANVRLRELTADQYSLVAEDGQFRIVDHRNADELRDARSLSGGETFLTSLALALALADSSIDMAADGAAPLESIFLDEGFGTLDPDTLEVVAGTIEELGATGRMVGIVTHIRDLAERMPTRLEITKGPTGSTVQRVDI